MADLKAVLEKHTFERKPWIPDDLRACQKMARELYAALAQEEQLDEMRKPHPDQAAIDAESVRKLREG